MAQVVPHTTAPFHQLHLLLVDAKDSTIGVGIAVQPDNEAVGKRCYLVVVADASHRTACGYDVTEMIQQFKNLLH